MKSGTLFPGRLLGLLIVSQQLCGATIGSRIALAAEPVIALAPPGIPAPQFPAPDRPVASIISPIWASEDERRSVDETGQVFGLLGIRKGMRVADIGAGSEYYTMLLARAVGPQGEVFAEDITPDYLAALRKRVLDAKLANVKVGLGEEHDPRLPARSLDVAVLVHMYHEIAQLYALLYNLAAAMKPEALIGIVDLDRPTDEHGTPPDLLRCELTAVGYMEAGFHKLQGGVGYLDFQGADTSDGTFCHRPLPLKCAMKSPRQDTVRGNSHFDNQSYWKPDARPGIKTDDDWKSPSRTPAPEDLRPTQTALWYTSGATEASIAAPGSKTRASSVLLGPLRTAQSRYPGRPSACRVGQKTTSVSPVLCQERT